MNHHVSIFRNMGVAATMTVHLDPLLLKFLEITHGEGDWENHFSGYKGSQNSAHDCSKGRGFAKFLRN